MDLDKLEALASKANSGLPSDSIAFSLAAINHETILALIAEVRALREDAERLAWWFRFDPPKDNDFVNVYLKGMSERWNLDRWRDAIDAARGAK